MSTDSIDDAAQMILDAASRRFLHYGYGKTTMSEIAQDCGMSTGNLYRYFPSKLDIAEMFVRRLRREHVEQLRGILDDSSLSPSEKVRLFFRRKLQLAYDRFHDKPKAFELSQSLLAERPKVAIEWENAEGRVLSEILRQGAGAGKFGVDDAQRMARILQDACYRFTSPAVFHEGDFDELVVELDDVLGLVLDGMRARARRPQA